MRLLLLPILCKFCRSNSNQLVGDLRNSVGKALDSFNYVLFLFRRMYVIVRDDRFSLWLLLSGLNFNEAELTSEMSDMVSLSSCLFKGSAIRNLEASKSAPHRDGSPQLKLQLRSELNCRQHVSMSALRMYLKLTGVQP